MVALADIVFLTASVFGQSVKDGLMTEAENGDVGCSYLLGLDEYVKGNYEEAVKWLCKAAEKGDSGSQALLGDCYYY